ncbi:MAG: B12-binding domain-containing radical SAM protein [Rhodospirillales bacterium]|nr:B12-binding domain-containing radical SAM protein [Rhodospirillales bacterium]
MTNILMMKVPTFEYPEDVEATSVAEQATFSWTLSLAMASVAGFVESYFKGTYTLEQFDMNGVVAGVTGSLNELGDKTLEAAAKKIRETDFDVFAVSVQFLFSQQYADEIIKMAKKKNPNATVVVGGGFATIFPDNAINKPDVDYAVIGEGEHTFVHILNKICGIDDPEFIEKWHFDGYAEKLADGSVMQVPKSQFLQNLEDLSQPLWNKADYDKLLGISVNASIPIMASRGCPMGCSFCSTHLTWGKPVRFRPAEEVVREVMTAYERYGFKGFGFIDDNITFNNDWFVDFCDKLAAVKPDDIKITFSNFDMRFLNTAVLRGLKKIGVTTISIATESGTKEVQREISKKLNLDRVRKVVKEVQAEGIYIHNCFVIGFPNETIEQMHETVAFARELKTESIQMWPVFPFPGTRLHDEADALGFITFDEEDYGSLRYRKGGIQSPNWDVETVKEIAYDAIIEMNFLSTPYYDTQEGRLILKGRVNGVAQNIDGHVMANIVSGYLDANFYGNEESRNSYYGHACTLLLEEDCLFNRYMKLDYPAIKDFSAWVEANCPEVFHQIFVLDIAGAKKISIGQKMTASQVSV